MPDITQNEKRIIRTFSVKCGNSGSAMANFIGYLNGSEGYVEDLELASEYLHYAANLGHPEALCIISNLYGGGNYGKLRLKPNLNEQIKYLRMLYRIDQIVDLDEINGGRDKEKYHSYQWHAYAAIGRIYIMNEVLNNQNLGYAISLKLSEENNMTESLFAMGYWYYISGEKYYETAMSYFKRAFDNDNSYWAQQSVDYYNSIVDYLNDDDNY